MAYLSTASIQKTRLGHEGSSDPGSGEVSPVYEALVCATCPARRSEICGELAMPELKDLSAATIRQHFASGDTVVWDGDPATHGFIVTRGALRVSKVGSDGRRQILAFLFGGDVMTLPERPHYAVTVEALTQGEVCRFERRRFEAVMAKYPQLEKSYRKSAAHKLDIAYDHAFTLGRRTAMERLAAFLLDLKSGSCPKTPTGTLALPMSRSDIADYLGLTIETVSRIFSRLKALKVIVLPAPQEVVVLDVERLRALAESDVSVA